MLAVLSACLLFSCVAGLADFEVVPQLDCVCVDTPSVQYRYLSKSDCVLKCLANDQCRTFRYTDSTGACEQSSNYHGCFHYIPEGSVLYRKSASKPVNASKCLMQMRSYVYGELSFARNWSDYVNGFGDKWNFWLGLNKIHRIANGNASVSLRVRTSLGSNYYSYKYTGFVVKGPADRYAMDYFEYKDPGYMIYGDSLLMSRGAEFATFDSPSGSRGQLCSAAHGNSGWWFSSGDNCTEANPNGINSRHGIIGDRKYMSWFAATGEWLAMDDMTIYLEY